MNEIDQILSNIDKDDNDTLFPEPNADAARNDEIKKLIESLDSSNDKDDGSAERAESEHGGSGTDDEGRAEADQIGTPMGTPEPNHHDEGFQETDVRGIFSIKGTKTWNRREPYTIVIDENQYRIDVENLSKAFFFVEDPSDMDVIKQKIKQEIVVFLRRPTEHVTERYTDFICKIITITVKELSDNFKIDPETEKIFIYHLGPQTIYKYLKDVFFQNKYGYCYKYIPGNKAIRFFPDEFIKEIVLKWFEENINVLNLPFDSIHKYEEIKKFVTRKYYNDLRIFNARLDQLNSKLGSDKSISRIKLFQIKGAPWFGHLNINVYRRFLGGTIFM